VNFRLNSWKAVTSLVLHGEIQQAHFATGSEASNHLIRLEPWYSARLTKAMIGKRFQPFPGPFSTQSSRPSQPAATGTILL